MKILHTSDWHLGRSLYGRKRYEEFSAFLDWLTQTIENEKVDALLVAGDVFDTSTPSNRARALLSFPVPRCCILLPSCCGDCREPRFAVISECPEGAASSFECLCGRFHDR